MTSTTHDKTIERPSWLTEEVWPFEVRSVDVDEHRIAYTDEGRGPVLLLVHDGMWSYVWGSLIDRLREEYRVVTLDFPGSGLSPQSDHPTSLEADSHLLEGFADALGLAKITLVLHDLGGAVGMGLAARRPELIDGFVLVNTFAWPPHVASLRMMLAVMGSAPMRAFDVATNLVPRLTSGAFGIGRHLGEAGRRAFLGGFRAKTPRRRFHDLMAAARAETDYLAAVEEALGSTLATKPALTIYGERNDPFGFQEKFRNHFADVDEMVIPKGNHFPMADEPDAVARRIAGWHEAKVEA